MTDRLKYRLLEIIPGTITWTILLGAVILSFFKPVWVVIFIIIFDLFWAFRISYFVFYLLIAWKKYKSAGKRDWLGEVQSMEGWDGYTHMVFLPTYNESLTVLTTTLDNILASDYPNDKFIIIIGFEGRVDSDIVNPKIEYLHEHYDDKFMHLLTTVHPPDLVGEIAGKAANAHWMGHRSKELVDELGLDYDKIIVSYFDCDTQAHRKYFSAVTHAYLTHPNPTRASYQPAVLYNNNIWDSHAVMRITAFSTVFWLMVELIRPERMLTFSSHSMSYCALVDVGFWQKDIVTDDSRIFLQCYMHYNGDYEIVPIYTPVSMDACLDDDYWTNYVNLYKQMRRWAWGVEHFPYMVWNFRKKGKLIPLWSKVKHLYNYLEGMIFWSTAALMITFLGRLPLWVVDKYYTSSEVASSFLLQHAPFILEKLMFWSMVGLFGSAFISLLLLPPRPKHKSIHASLSMIWQWALLPISLIFFGSLPAIDAQTRLMFGKYLGFFVTPKARK